MQSFPEWIQAVSQETVYFLLAGFSSSVHEKADYVTTGALVSTVSKVAELEIVKGFRGNKTQHSKVGYKVWATSKANISWRHDSNASHYARKCNACCFLNERLMTSWSYVPLVETAKSVLLRREADWWRKSTFSCSACWKIFFCASVFVVGLYVVSRWSGSLHRDHGV